VFGCFSAFVSRSATPRPRQARSDTEAASSISSVRGRISIEDAEGVLSYYQRSAQRTPTACDLQFVRSRFSFCCRMHVPWELRTCAILRRPFVLDTGGGVDDMRPRITSPAKGRWIYTRRLKRLSNFRRHHASGLSPAPSGRAQQWEGRGLKGVTQ
jgi:hypothetical protein